VLYRKTTIKSYRQKLLHRALNQTAQILLSTIHARTNGYANILLFMHVYCSCEQILLSRYYCAYTYLLFIARVLFRTHVLFIHPHCSCTYTVHADTYSPCVPALFMRTHCSYTRTDHSYGLFMRMYYSCARLFIRVHCSSTRSVHAYILFMRTCCS
jgi:hypothetical protein